MRVLLLSVLILIGVGINGQVVLKSVDINTVENSVELISPGKSFSIPSMNELSEIEVLSVDGTYNPNHKFFNDRSFYNIKSGVNSGKLMISPRGVFITIMTPGGLLTLKPAKNKESYIVEQGRVDEGIRCMTMDVKRNRSFQNKRTPDVTNGDFIRRYRLALLTTGEFYEENGADMDAVIDAIIFSINGLNTIFLQELSIEFVVDDRVVIFTNKDTDPFTPDLAGGLRRTLQAGKVINDVYNAEDYDVGHVLHNHLTGTEWSTGGIASISSACDNDVSSDGVIGKGSGWSGDFFNNNNNWIELFTHEVAHMVGATHTFNGTGQSCTNNISKNNAVEIGSGTTIMSYRGICRSDQNITIPSSDPSYFHIRSIEEILSFVDGIGTCYQSSPAENQPPEVDFNSCVNDPFQIPVGTPFILQASANDPDGDQLQFNWEQVDEDGIGISPTQGFIGDQAASSSIAPIFRSRPPGDDPFRSFPDPGDLYYDIDNPFDVLPQVKRDVMMKFNVRDGAGGIASQSVSLFFDKGPLEITSPIENQEIIAGENFTLNWLTNGSDEFCDKVDIYIVDMSSNGIEETLVDSDVEYNAETHTFYIPPSIHVEGEIRIKMACADFSCYSFFQVSEVVNYQNNCGLTRHLICNDSPVTAPEGDESLDLEVGITSFSVVSSIEMDIDENDDFRIFPRNDASGDCEIVRFSSGGEVFTPQEFFEFQVEKSGSYTFTKTGGTFFTIFDATNYDLNNPCTSFIESNATGNPESANPTSTFISSSFTVELSSCTPYLMMASVFTEPGQISIVGNGPGKIILPGNNRLMNALSFMVLNEDDVVLSIIATPDLRSLDKGKYSLISLETSPEVDLSSIQDKSINEIKAGSLCNSIGSNKLEINITAGDRDGDGFDSDIDCNDSDAAINPGVDEIPNNDVDENCDGVVEVIDEDMDGFNSDVDCNDGDAAVNPGADEIPNNDVDENCDGVAEMIDEDMDGFNSDVDCNDGDAAVNPGADEIPNNDVDENCDGVAEMIDEDMDGYNSDVDCNDSDAAVNPGADEIPNNDVDENCDGVVEVIDEDMDGFNSDEDCDDNDATINPDAEEIPNNGVDEDCDGQDASTSILEVDGIRLKVYPNPFYGMITIENSYHGILDVSLVNMKGEKVKELKLERHHTQIDLSDMMPGVYFMTIRSSHGKIHAMKLVKL